MKSAKTVFSQYLKDNGMLRSERRELILDVFLTTEKHPTVEDIYDLARKKDPRIALATVYRAMKVICDAGLATETGFGDGVRRFEHKYRHKHHDHLVCLQCGRVIEVVSAEIEDLQGRLAARHGFVPESHKMQIFGTCSKCKRKKK